MRRFDDGSGDGYGEEESGYVPEGPVIEPAQNFAFSTPVVKHGIDIVRRDPPI